MAWLEQRARTYHLVFRFANQRFKKSLRTEDEDEAERLLIRAERRLRLIEQGDLPLTEDVDLPTFLISHGRQKQPVNISKRLPHLKHIERQLGPRFDISRLSLSDLAWD